jgi:hypothetical protein
VYFGVPQSTRPRLASDLDREHETPLLKQSVWWTCTLFLASPLKFIDDPSSYNTKSTSDNRPRTNSKHPVPMPSLLPTINQRF